MKIGPPGPEVSLHGYYNYHYAPLLAKIGFEPLNCAIERGKTQCTCKRHRDVGILVTDEDSEAFVLAVVRRRQ